MTPRPPAVDPGRHAAPPRRGVAAAVAVAVLGIGAGTWFLGSGPDTPAPAEDGVFSTIGVVPEVPSSGAEQAPALSVAPAPSEEAYAAARRAGRTGTRATPADAGVAKKKPARANAADPASTDLVASG